MSMIPMNMKIKLSEGAVLPVRGSAGAAGYDLSAPTNFAPKELLPGERVLIKTGLFMEIPPGLYGRIAPRSGLAYKYGIAEMAGVIDEDYRDEIGVIVINHDNNKAWVINPGDRIAQIIFERYHTVNFIQLSQDQNLDSSDRAGGFGSTGAGILAPRELTFKK